MSRRHLSVVVVIFALGALLRLLGFFDLQLWCDEGMWATRLATDRWGWIRPVGYMWLTHALTGIVNDEPMLRSLSYIGGLAQLPLLYLLLRRAVAFPVFAIVGTYLLAIHPIAVAMTKEFKPYALESCLHTLLITLTLVYCASPKPRWLAGLLLLAVVSPLLAWTVIFAFPAVFSVVALHAFWARRPIHVVASVAGGLSALMVVAGLTSARVTNSEETAEYWGRKYDVFIAGDSTLSERILWFVDKTADIGAFPARLELLWSSATSSPGHRLLATASMILCVVGVAALIARKRWSLLALLVSPWLLTLVFNLGKQWPYGAFRTNVFLIFYTVALVAIGADSIAALVQKLPTAAQRGVGVVGVALLIAIFPFNIPAFQHKRESTFTREAAVRSAMTKLQDIEVGAGKSVDERRLLVMDGHACRIFAYYRDVNDATRVAFHDWFSAHFDTSCAYGESRGRYRQHLDEQRGKSFWLISAKRSFDVVARKRLAASCTPEHVQDWPEGTLLYYCNAFPQP